MLYNVYRCTHCLTLKTQPLVGKTHYNFFQLKYQFISSI